MSWNENACQFCREALVQLPPSWSPHPPPLRVSTSHRQYRDARRVNPLQGQRPGPTTYKGRSAQVRNLHVVNLRLWCNFSEVPGELLMGPGRFLRSYLPTPWLRTPVGLRPSTKGCGVFPGPIPPTEPKLFRDSTVAPLSIKSVSAWRAPSGPGTWTEGKDQVKEG